LAFYNRSGLYGLVRDQLLCDRLRCVSFFGGAQRNLLKLIYPTRRTHAFTARDAQRLRSNPSQNS
jgi:hypothetical protein